MFPLADWALRTQLRHKICSGRCFDFLPFSLFHFTLPPPPHTNHNTSPPTFPKATHKPTHQASLNASPKWRLNSVEIVSRANHRAESQPRPTPPASLRTQSISPTLPWPISQPKFRAAKIRPNGMESSDRKPSQSFIPATDSSSSTAVATAKTPAAMRIVTRGH